MNIDIQHRPAHSLAVVSLQDGEQIRAESGAMVSMSSNVQVTTDSAASKKSGGLVKGLKRAVLGGESFFTNRFRAAGGPGEVTLAPSLCGDMVVHQLAGDDELFIQGSSYVAAPDSVQLDTSFQGLKGLFSGEAVFFLRATGEGPVLLNAFGGVDVRELDGQLIVDTGHLVAFTGGLSYEVARAAKGLVASLLSGEGLVLRFTGRGRIYIQTRNPSEYGSTVGRKLPPREG